MHDRAAEAPESVPPLTSMPPTAAESRLIADRPAMTGGVEELIAFLTARLDDAEAAARDLLRIAGDVRLALQDPQLLGRVIPGWHSWADVEAMCEGALRDVAAKRAILDWLGHQDRVYGDYSVIETLELVVRHLGAELSDHPDYRAEWCPECEDGLVRVAGCNCGDGLPPYGHEPLCGWEPCPNGCWERLHPQPEPEGKD